MIRTIPAREIKRRGISAIDEMIEEGPVHVIRNDQPTYVIMTEEHYQALAETQREVELAGIRDALEDLDADRVRKVTAGQLIEEADLDADA